MLATIRKDGIPRISPIGLGFIGEELFLGMMPQTVKALDLLRDPRCSICNVVTHHKDGEHGEFKLYGHAVDMQDKSVRKRYGDWCEEVSGGWRPDEPYHLFTFDIRFATLVVGRDATVWESAT